MANVIWQNNPYSNGPIDNTVGTWTYGTSPIVLDLNGDGVKTTALTKGAWGGTHFNLDAKGLSEQTGWVDKDDGLLVRDLDGDGQITSGRELFGNHTRLNNGKAAANGFEALKELDDNADGVIDANVRPTVDLVAHGVMTPYHVTRKRRVMDAVRKPAPASGQDDEGWQDVSELWEA